MRGEVGGQGWLGDGRIAEDYQSARQEGAWFKFNRVGGKDTR